MRMILLVIIIASVAQIVRADIIEGYCLEKLGEPPILEKLRRQDVMQIRGEARDIPGSPFTYSIPSEEKIRLTHTEMGYTTEFWSPTGDWPMAIIGYDPENHILYGDSYFDAAWIKLEIFVNTVIVIDKGVVHPSLYRSSDSLKYDSHGPLRYSAALHSLFYSGYALSWWQRYGLQSLVIKDGTISRVPNYFGEILVYLADDLTTNMAVLTSENGELFLFDGERVVAADNPFFYWQDDPLSEFDLVRDRDGRPYWYDGKNFVEIDMDHELSGRVSKVIYRQSINRWIMVSNGGRWFEYEVGLPLRDLQMPMEIVDGWMQTSMIPNDVDALMFTRKSIWLADDLSASIQFRLPDELQIFGPATVKKIEDQEAIAFAVGPEGEWNEKEWYLFSVFDEAGDCLELEVLSVWE